MASSLSDFTSRLLTRHGALVDSDGDEMAAVMPPRLAAALQVPEYQRFAFPRAEAPAPIAETGRRNAADVHMVGYDSPLVDQFESLVDRLGRIARVPPPELALKTIDPADLVAGTLTLANGIVRDCRAGSVRADYVGFIVEFELLADERISGMAEIWVNATTRSVPRMQGLVSRLLPVPEDAADRPAGGGPDQDVSRIVGEAWGCAAVLARADVDQRLQDSIASLRRRRERDFTRLREYYEAIDEGIRRRARRALARKDEAAVQAETSRLEATAQAFRGRVADLVDRYRVRVRLKPLAAVVCRLPAHLVTARLHRRSASRSIQIAWNAIDRALEWPPCDGCGIGTSTAILCDDRVHLLCSQCQRTCEMCGRFYCRACHPHCPRQHR